jgi:hypothetical protein
MKKVNPFWPILKLIRPLPLLSILLISLSASKPTSLNNKGMPVSGTCRNAGIPKQNKISRQRPDPDKKAEFPGGRKVLRDYLHDNFNVPKVAFKMKNKEVLIGAQMELQIGTDGSATLLKLANLRVQPKDPAIIQAVKTEFTRFVAQMPKWTPALKDGRPVVSTDTLAYITSFAPNVTWEDYISLKNKTQAEREKTTFSANDLRTKDGKKVYTFVQKQASFPGGDKALKEYLTQHLKYLQQQQNTGELVVLNIIVNEKGMAEDLKIVKPEGITISLAEVEAVLKQMPAWTPGKQSGKPLPVSYTFPVRF